MLAPTEYSLILNSDPGSGSTNLSADGSVFQVYFQESMRLPSDIINATIALESAYIWNSSPNILTGINDKLYIHGLDTSDVEQDFILTLEQGLYDLTALNATVLRLLENANAKVNPLPIISLSGDDSTQKIVFLFNYDTTTIDFTGANTPRILLGMSSTVLGPYAGAPEHVYGTSMAAFNTITSFLVHSDLADQGIALNNSYSQIVGQVAIDVNPGSQITYQPFNAPRSSIQKLADSSRDSILVWITDQNNNPVNMAGEYYTIRLTIRYLTPLFIQT